MTAVVLSAEREFLIDNLLVRIHFIIVLIRWTVEFNTVQCLVSLSSFICVLFHRVQFC